MITNTRQSEALYRTQLKRMIRRAGGDVLANADTEILELAFRGLSRDFPNEVAAQFDHVWKQSALAWEQGNNSGDSAILTMKEKESRMWGGIGERMLALLGITCDWPGLYPSYKVAGYDYHSALSAILAVNASKAVAA